MHRASILLPPCSTSEAARLRRTSQAVAVAGNILAEAEVAEAIPVVGAEEDMAAVEATITK